jgi:hypothetical protein
MRLIVAIGSAVAVVVVAILVAQLAGGGASDSGPLQISGDLQVEYPLPVDTVTTWGVPFPESEMTPAEVTDVQLQEVNNLEVVGIAACVGWQLQPDGSYNHCAPMNSMGWPPSGVSIVPVSGLALGTTARDSPGLLIGVRRLEPNSDGTIGSIRILYRAGRTSYFAIEPWSLRLTVPD